MNKNQKTILILLGLVLLALMLRLFLVQYRQCIESDGTDYVSIARELVGEHRFSNLVRHPGYPFFIGLASYLIHDYELAGRIVSAVFGALITILTFFLGKEIYDKRTGLIASILVVIHPALTEYSTMVLTESIFSFFLTLFLLISGQAIKSSKSWLYAFSGCLIGIAYLIRPEALGFIPYFIAVSLSIMFISKEIRFKILIKNLSIFLFASMIFILPYMISVGGLSGKIGNFTFVETEIVEQENYSRELDLKIQEYKTSPHKFPSFTEKVVRHPLKLVKYLAINLHLTQKYVLTFLFPPLLLIAIGFGVFRAKFSFTKWKELYAIFTWVPYIIVFFLYVVPRVFLPLVPVSLIFAAQGIEIIGNRLSNRIGKLMHPKATSLGYLRHITRVSAIRYLILIVVLLSLIPYTFRPLYRKDENAIYKEVGIWVKEHFQQSPIKIIDRNPSIAFYSGAERIRLPIGEYNELIKYAYRENATHLVIDNKAIPNVCPELIFLLSKYYVPPELKLIKEFKQNSNGLVILLYQILRKDKITSE